MAGPKDTLRGEGRILLFPGVQAVRLTSFSGESSVAPSKHSLADHRPELHSLRHNPIDVVLCGTFRMDTEGLAHAFEQLRDLGCRIRSPGNVQRDGFGSMRGEEIETHERRKLKQLDAIQQARFIWLHAPKGYVGPTASLEIGFAVANGVPIFSSELPKDVVLQKLVRVVTSPQEVLDILHNQLEPPVPALQTLRQHYRRAALECEYEDESAQNRLPLMMEEVGELARALWSRIFGKARKPS
jgi:hypothetical protein